LHIASSDRRRILPFVPFFFLASFLTLKLHHLPHTLLLVPFVDFFVCGNTGGDKKDQRNLMELE
jgi:hypothetical protein